jgi:UDP-N-acetylmuramate dehydrogenase
MSNRQMKPPQHNVPLSGRTTFRIGGPGRYYLAPGEVSDIRDAAAWALQNRAPVLVLGKGSNLLVSDSGWDGLVIDLSAHWTGIQWDGRCADCRSGTLLHALVNEAAAKGLAGIERLAGIPGSIGGAIVMNAGAFGQTVSQTLVSVEYLDIATARIAILAAAELSAGYRTTVFTTSAACILSALFCFTEDTSGQARKAFDETLAKRRDRHPLDLPNCGSVFKNPPGTTAGKLIEHCGLKGVSAGDAEVSRKHANFIVNRGAARAADVRSLIVRVQKTVYEKTGVLLEPEVVFAGTFDEPLYSVGQ